jgi:hypothetical protein
LYVLNPITPKDTTATAGKIKFVLMSKEADKLLFPNAKLKQLFIQSKILKYIIFS